MMHGTAQISVYCPPMYIYKNGLAKRVTADEPMTMTATFVDQTKLIIPNIDLPPTPVRRLGLFNWLVAPCIGHGEEIGGFGSFTVDLPEEPTTMGWWGPWFMFTMIARKITAPCTLVLNDGSVGLGSVIFPDTPVNILKNPMQAAVCIAEGSVSFP